MHSTESIADTLARYREMVHGEMCRVFQARGELDTFYGMMRYHLGWVDACFEPGVAPHGKGLRAALLMLLNHAFGGDDAMAAPLAAGVELLHNFSLVHDDIEDGSTMRRHRPTAWNLWGVPPTINMGDGLYALAHLALCDSPLRRVAPARFVDLICRFELAAVHLCEGQHLDMTYERAAAVSVEEYLRMIERKTATLIAAAASIGAQAAGASTRRTNAAEQFGRSLGMAFQIQDDILGIWGDEAVTGKSVVSDIASRKKTLPILLAMACAAPADRDRLLALYSQANRTEQGTQAIMAILDRAGARELAGAYLHQAWDDGMGYLQEMDLSAEAHARLLALVRLFVDRTA